MIKDCHIKWRYIEGKAENLSKAIDKLAEYEDTGLTPEEIKALSKQVEDAIKAIGNLQLLVIKKQQENEKARADAWYMMEKWSDAKDKLDEYHKGEAAVEGGALSDQ